MPLEVVPQRKALAALLARELDVAGMEAGVLFVRGDVGEHLVAVVAAEHLQPRVGECVLQQGAMAGGHVSALTAG